MADEEQEENWPEFFENNRLIPVHPNRRKSESQTKPNVPFCLLFKSVIGISLPAASVSLLPWKYKSCSYCSKKLRNSFIAHYLFFMFKINNDVGINLFQYFNHVNVYVDFKRLLLWLNFFS